MANILIAAAVRVEADRLTSAELAELHDAIEEIGDRFNATVSITSRTYTPEESTC